MRDTTRKDTLQDASWGNNQMTAGSWFFPCLVREYYTFCTFYLQSRPSSLHTDQNLLLRGLARVMYVRKISSLPALALLGHPVSASNCVMFNLISFPNHGWACLCWWSVSANFEDIHVVWHWKIWLSQSSRLLTGSVEGLYFAWVKWVWCEDLLAHWRVKPQGNWYTVS